MRVNSISTYNVGRTNFVQQRNYSNKQNVQEPNTQQNVNFKGKLGAIAGGVFGAITAAATFTVGLPVIVAAAGYAVGGSVVEDIFKKKKEENQTEKDS